VPGKSAKHPLPREDVLTELMCNVLLDAVSHNPVVNFSIGLFHPPLGCFSHQNSVFTKLHRTARNAPTRLCTKVLDIGFSLCNLCVSVVRFWSGFINRRETENTEVAQRRRLSWLFVQSRANPTATVEVECVVVTGGMLCALSISDSPKKL